MKPTSFDQIIVGIDPGTVVLGYGVLGIKDDKMYLIQFGVIKLAQWKDHYVRLQKIYDRVSTIIEEFKPQQMALEAPFFGKNVQSMLKLGRAQGVCMAAALSRGVSVEEYAPRKIKQAVTGKGTASKEQVASMLQTLLSFDEIPDLLDATDAVGVAVCHYFQQNALLPKSTSWSAFLEENPDRVS